MDSALTRRSRLVVLARRMIQPYFEFPLEMYRIPNTKYFLFSEATSGVRNEMKQKKPKLLSSFFVRSISRTLCTYCSNTDTRSYRVDRPFLLLAKLAGFIIVKSVAHHETLYTSTDSRLNEYEKDG